MKKYNRESGQTLIMVALSMTALIGFAAFATDVGVTLHEKREAQSAADSAAIAAATAMNSGASATSAEAAGVADAALNGFSSSNGATVTVTVDPTDNPNPVFNAAGFVEAEIEQAAPTSLVNTFVHLFNQGSSNVGWSVGARAVATWTGNATTGCGTILNPQNLQYAAKPWGNSTINSPNCGWLINGGLDLGASDAMDVASVGATGSIIGASHITGTYVSPVPPASNPRPDLSSSIPTVTNGSCGTGCYLNTPLTPTSGPGTYLYTIAADATFSGIVNITGATIILTNGSILSATGSGGGAGNATLTLTAPSTGTYAGVVIDAPNYTGELDLDFGATLVNLTGMIYAPLADLSLQDQGGGGANGSGVTVTGDLVLGTLDINDKNKGNITVNAPTSAAGGLATTRVTLVQ
jgi:hypothetical protein